MQCHRLGHSCLQVSELPLGSWVRYQNQVNVLLPVKGWP